MLTHNSTIKEKINKIIKQNYKLIHTTTENRIDMGRKPMLKTLDMGRGPMPIPPMLKKADEKTSGTTRCLKV